MNTDTSSSSGRTRRPHRHAGRRILPLILVAFFTLVASAEAHNMSASPACTATGNTVTITWTNFAVGTGNGGENQPTWQIVYTPNGGAPITYSGQVTFPGTTFSTTVPVAGTAGTAVVSSAWTAATTTDLATGSFSTNLTIPSCLGTPAITTTASGGVPAGGGPITDTAVLSGGNSPQGTITFNLYQASDTMCSTPLATVTTPVAGDGTYTSPAVTETTAGTYQWTASYGGDINNNIAVEGCGSGAAEQVVVPPPNSPPPPPPPPPAKPTILTRASSGPVVAGTPISDTATLSGGAAPTGKITFNLYAASDTTCKTALATETATVNGNGDYTSPAVPESTAGTYSWTASYSGDANNAAAAEGCNDGGALEQIVVTPLPPPLNVCPGKPVLTGVYEKVTKSFTAKLTTLNVETVTFYLDGHKLKTLNGTKASFFVIKINVTHLAHGHHMLAAKVTTKGTLRACNASLQHGFIYAKIHHHFTPVG